MAPEEGLAPRRAKECPRVCVSVCLSKCVCVCVGQREKKEYFYHLSCINACPTCVIVSGSLIFFFFFIVKTYQEQTGTTVFDVKKRNPTCNALLYNTTCGLAGKPGRKRNSSEESILITMLIRVISPV